ncbi:MAG: pentapeptide repeat-containing protein [Deltaproteobacteria bacterium]|nr:pentapeptide repeat-containing protein [Deltaproteobacteria bacterium]
MSFVRLLRALAVAMLCVAGCGDDDSSPAGPPTPPAGGVSEAFLAAHPDAAVNATHTVFLDLEASEGGAPDTGVDAGVDEVPYYFARRTELTLAVADQGDATPRLILRDEMGGIVVQVGPAGRSQTVTLAGAFTLQVRHPRAGDAGAAPQPVFLRPRLASAGNRDLATVEADQDCPNCNLRGVTLTGAPLELFGINLSGTDFTGATVHDVAFFGTNLAAAIFDRTQFESVIFSDATMTGARFTQAAFLPDPGNTCQGPSCRTHDDIPPGSCCVIHCNTSFETTQGPIALAMADFSGATFQSACLGTAVLQGASFAGASFDYASSVAADFAGSDLRGARFAATDVLGRNAEGQPEAGLSPASFVGATLSDDSTGASFSDVDLTGTDFSGCDLRQASFVGSTLTPTTNFAGANFSGSDFAGVDLSQADLSGATLSTATSFVGATLSDGSAHGVNLACLPAGTGGCQFAPKTTQFKGANLSYATLDGAGLEEADLEGTILDNASLIAARLNLASLKNASLRGVRAGVQPGTMAPVTEFGGAYMVNVDLTNADLRSADLSNAHLYGTSKLVGTQLDSAALGGAICAGAAFSGSFNDTTFDHAVLVNATFNGADLTDAKFELAYLQGADFSAATSVLSATILDAGVSTSPGSWTFNEQDGTPFTFAYGATQLGPFSTDPSVTCPNGDGGPCTAGTLTPVTGPFPPIPRCVPTEQFCFENCLTPPNFTNHPPCQ